MKKILLLNLAIVTMLLTPAAAFASAEDGTKKANVAGAKSGNPATVSQITPL